MEISSTEINEIIKLATANSTNVKTLNYKERKVLKAALESRLLTPNSLHVEVKGFTPEKLEEMKKHLTTPSPQESSVIGRVIKGTAEALLSNRLRHHALASHLPRTREMIEAEIESLEAQAAKIHSDAMISGSLTDAETKKLKRLQTAMAHLRDEKLKVTLKPPPP